MTTTALMIGEALDARNEIAGELKTALYLEANGGHVDGEWKADRIDALLYYNRLLLNLGYKAE